ncbi:MAG TPA: AgmX/PglI C-terminal domain-containing protein [Leptospiraceae bacterium]|nr:AgmX/PglI C-terminal domain-containing protein [Leptospiraceae bacterium]HMW05091.1 AgmX/PglI C-terminal domain-containing protein [Leptospiraceae bacterium]HMX31345.1 AgmX/PglI C-terminal domain-containing protein [Leptospiraceae bacterium]HMY31612.1 AgmX/PglI C-terminal domain-containing protein [Leptospiraceae bacterium]HMZ66134.1 AgmX/PglI C-terminal domain-containing protein [Leptospiraceae bacterium]
MDRNKIFIVASVLIVFVFGYFLFERSKKETIAPLQIETDKKGLSHYHKREVNNTIKKHMGSIQSCYNQMLEKNPKVTEGKIQFDWQIKPDGDVVKAEKIQSDFDSTDLEDCIKKEISSWSFPPPPEQNRNTYSEFTFHFVKKENLEKQKDNAPKMINTNSK